jgi:hypothetical protein
VAQASSAAALSNTAARTDLTIIDSTILTALNLLSTVPLQTIISVLNLNSSQIGALLSAANQPQVDTILAGLTAPQLTGAVDSLATAGTLDDLLGTMLPAQVGDLLAPLTGGTLTSATSVLSTNQLVGALGTLNPADLASVVDGLTAVQTGQVLSALSSGNPGELTSVLAALTGVQLTDGLGALNFVQLGALLAPLTGSNLTTIVGSLTTGQLGGGLGTLTPGQLSTLLSAANGAQLSSLVAIVSALTPAQITSVLGQAGAPANVVTGLAGRSTTVAGAPNVTDVSGLLGQVQALLGGGLPAVPGTAGLLNTVRPLLGVAGLDTAMLTGLLNTAKAAIGTAAPGPGATALQGVIDTLQTVLAGTGAVPGGTTPGTGTKPGTTTKPKTGAANGGQAAFRAYRATIGSVKVAKNRRSATMTLACPGSAPKGCLVAIDGVVAGKKAFAQKAVVVMRNVTHTLTVKLTSSVAKRLKTKGGSLRISARTVNASLGAISKTVKVKKAARKR